MATVVTPETITAWIVVFLDDGKAHGPWRWLTRKGFRHCLVIGWSSEHEVWVIYDPLFNGTFIQVASQQTVEAVLNAFDRLGATMIQVNSRRTNEVIWTLPPLYCVDRVKSVLGVRAWWVKTPLQLYRHLVARHGAMPLISINEEDEAWAA